MSFRGWGTALVGLFCLFTRDARAIASRYPSGLLHSFAVDKPPDNSADKNAVARFIDVEFGAYTPQFEWRLLTRIDDAQQVHFTYALYAEGIEVADRWLKVHFNRAGYVEYASSNWQTAFSVQPGAVDVKARRRGEIADRFLARNGVSAERIDLKPAIWSDGRQERMVPAFEVILTCAPRHIYRRFFIARDTGEWLSERGVARYADIYPISPLGGATFNSVTLPGLGAATSLTSTYLHVQRDQLSGGVSAAAEVDPTGAYSGSITTNPATYNTTCFSASTSGCPNQSFDAVNVYYHVESFRERLQGYFNTLGATVTFPADPLAVLVDSQSVDTNGDGQTSNDTNNAAYVNVPCHSSDASTSKCLVFLPPAVGSSTTCGDNITFYHMGREALISVHEYQHYITDTLTHMPMGTTAYNVGDALHEGFSDYMAASHVSQAAGSDVTLVGAYVFQNCATIQRDVGVLKVYKDGSQSSPHGYGLSWASGLWQLRRELGATTVDLLTVKTLFLLPTEPGFVDAVEALVAADASLNAGANGARIRRLFYQEIQFIGGNTGQFRDPDKAIIEMGLRSCGGVHRQTATSPWFAWVVLAWLLGTLSWGRAWVRA
jgi:hypothetical protein